MPPYELSERERQSLAQADRLNAIMSQSSIKSASEAAQIRAREQAAQRLDKSRQASQGVNALEAIAVKEALSGGGGPFDGTSIEAQMLNIIMNPNIPEDDPRKRAARQRLERERTQVGANGTTEIIPGYDVPDIIGGSPSSSSPGRRTVNAKPTESQRRAESVIGRLDQLNDSATGYKPGAWDFLATNFGGNYENWLKTEEGQLQDRMADEWVAQYGLMVSGAEVPEQQRLTFKRTFWPTAGDSKTVIAAKAKARIDAAAAAEAAYLDRNGGGTRTVKFEDM